MYLFPIKKNRTFLCGLFLFLTLTIPIFAESVVMRNGKVIKGKVLTQNSKTITIRTSDGQSQTIYKTKIFKVLYQDIEEHEAKKLIAEDNQKQKKEDIPKKEITKEEPKKEEPTLLPKKPTEEKEIQTISHRENRSRWSIVWRSAVLPGWGQYKADQKLWAYTEGGLFWASVIGAGLSYEQASLAKHHYHSQVRRMDLEFLFFPNFISNPTLSDLYYSQREKANYHALQGSNSAAKVSAGVVGIFYLANLVHSYFLGTSWENEATSQARLEFHVKRASVQPRVAAGAPLFYETRTSMAVRIRF